MRNLLLAITCFFATVLILSQVAVAADDDSGDPRHTTSAPGEDPNLAKKDSKSGTEAGVPNAGNDCPTGTCFPRTKGGALGDNTNPGASGSSSGSSSGSGSGNSGRQ